MQICSASSSWQKLKVPIGKGRQQRAETSSKVSSSPIIGLVAYDRIPKSRRN